MDKLRGAALGRLSTHMSGSEDADSEEGGWPLAHPPPAGAHLASADGASQVERFGRLLMRGDMAHVEAFLDGLRHSGVAPETIYIELVQETARKFGEWWLDDSCSFSEVTMGTIRLQQVLRELGPWFRGAVECPLPGHRILLVPSPGEQHTLGLFIVADFLTRSGWDVWGETTTGEAVMRLVRDEWFDVIGVSVGCFSRLETVTTYIQRLRSASRNGAVGIMVGGPVFVEHPEYAATVGADATAPDGSAVPRTAESLLAPRTRTG